MTAAAPDNDKLTVEFLQDLGACNTGLSSFRYNFPDGIPLTELDLDLASHFLTSAQIDWLFSELGFFERGSTRALIKEIKYIRGHPGACRLLKAEVD